MQRTYVRNNTKLYALVVTSSTQGNAELLQQLNLGFKRTINWNKYLSKQLMEVKNWYLDHLTSPSFQGVNRLFRLLFVNEASRIRHTAYYLPKIEIKDYSIKINSQDFFDQAVNKNIKASKNIQNVVTGQGVDYTTECFLDYPYFNESYKLVTIDLSKQQVLNGDPNNTAIIS